MDKEVVEVNQSWKVIRARRACLDGSSFVQTGAMNMHFDDVSLVGTKIHNANLSNIEIKHAQMGGAYFSEIGSPEEGEPHYDPATAGKPVRFEHCDLRGAVLSDCNLSQVEIVNCHIRGLKINGVDIEELIAIAANMKET